MANHNERRPLIPNTDEVPIDDLDGAEQVVGIFDEQLSDSDRAALGIDRLIPTDEVVVPEIEPEP